MNQILLHILNRIVCVKLKQSEKRFRLRLKKYFKKISYGKNEPYSNKIEIRNFNLINYYIKYLTRYNLMKFKL
ncbi:hypothetical protein BpHYR1_025966 [Brachionus plicatilis]|uniref:Uncharacterized protein n=1 Tax=Brachionus plicatilis TaxID=10195 RepID=A0A3M7SMN8_BRAPC|nr:hypothetical protein BpHYR1_025966 [Brachionus plicatilis]